MIIILSGCSNGSKNTFTSDEPEKYHEFDDLPLADRIFDIIDITDSTIKTNSEDADYQTLEFKKSPVFKKVDKENWFLAHRDQGIYVEYHLVNKQEAREWLKKFAETRNIFNSLEGIRGNNVSRKMTSYAQGKVIALLPYYQKIEYYIKDRWQANPYFEVQLILLDSGEYFSILDDDYPKNLLGKEITAEIVRDEHLLCPIAKTKSGVQIFRSNGRIVVKNN